ncbi:DNA polymerase-3 subunit beta [Marinitoga hydrogenitolerans DSM 16785]|uniref:Beta sliding clamp n=1 Tax=Marinitoga hydrogenitolerans (strain DSM 16785 / JCM 12826 / AT1271) TaxID=1122195 RepID=A0A1M4YNL7_MARH1|nr:DNA polymerase III subunit beta [Marinitoga hydrogenitolerans]SHF06986.1 DNA polymerase-3 subunit beta [Marinitoga hydrogenitolerans DSM 16785]
MIYKLQIERSKLNSLMDMASKAVAKKTTNPVLSGYKFSVKDNDLHIYATDLQTAFHGVIKNIIFEKVEKVTDDLFNSETDNLEENNETLFEETVTNEIKPEFVVDAAYFSDIIKNLSFESVDVYLENKNIKVMAGKSEFLLPTMDPDDFPEIVPNKVEEGIITFERQKLLSMIERVIFCALRDSENISRNLNGIYWDFREGGYLTLVAADGYRLALAELSMDIVNTPPSFLLSLKSMEELLNVLRGAKTENVELFFDGARVLFFLDNDNIEIILNVVDATFPDYIRIIPQAFKTKVITSTDLFLKVLKRVSIAAKNDQVKMEIKDSIMELTAKSPEVGLAVEELEVEKEGEDLLIAYSPKYLREAIDHIGTSEVEFNITSESSQTMIKPVGDDSYMYIVMPVRLK